MESLVEGKTIICISNAATRESSWRLQQKKVFLRVYIKSGKQLQKKSLTITLGSIYIRNCFSQLEQ